MLYHEPLVLFIKLFELLRHRGLPFFGGPDLEEILLFNKKASCRQLVAPPRLGQIINKLGTRYT